MTGIPHDQVHPDTLVAIATDLGLTLQKHYDGEGLEIIGAQAINVMISEDGRRVWVCTEDGTVLRAKTGHPDSRVTLEDLRLVKD